MTGPGEIDMDLLRELLRARREREKLSLREAADIIDVSAPTLQRIESGQLPTAPVILKVADWLKVSIDELRSKAPGRQQNTLEKIEVHLRADRHLPPEAAKAIATLVRDAYNVYAKDKKNR